MESVAKITGIMCDRKTPLKTNHWYYFKYSCKTGDDVWTADAAFTRKHETWMYNK